jgi:hypothetical protein
MILPDRGAIKLEDVERALELLEAHDLEAVNLLRAYIRGLESRALVGELLDEEENET